MARYRLISFKTCPWVQRAAIVLREKGVEFDFLHIESQNRPDWFETVSPHGKVPVLLIDEAQALFESNAITEFLEETIAPRLHPADPVQRALNRAWVDYIPAFSAALGAVYSARTEPELSYARDAVDKAFSRIEVALEKQAGGPFFNGEDYSLVDAGYAPFLQRWAMVEEMCGQRQSEDYPHVRRWIEALIERPSTHSFSPEEFRGLYLAALVKRGGVILETIAPAA